MKFVVVVLACVVVAASAQFQNNFPFKQYNPNKYNNQYNNQYNQYSQYNRNQYNRNQYNPNQYNPNQYNPNQNQYKNPFASRAPLASVVVSSPKPAVVPVEPVVSVVVPPPVNVPAVVLSQVARVASDDRSAEIVKYGDEFVNDGRNYYFESNNGIAAQAQIVPRNYGGNPPVISDVAQGSFSWKSPEGKVIAISYIADENGYQPSGDALPQAPEVPAQIARALAYAAKFSAGIKN